ncbi:hypothetical protein B9Z55_028025 [Caenorhabditis nigoni]|uniref:Uncharacterized protein n=2 Tax=Caenorhabditis nigoni TaxID=1611254 RepID=A0A2G5SDC8_9PELO|nr:hypothetical protein B9Z55_028025 [Caenorhabditis nigoni]
MMRDPKTWFYLNATPEHRAEVRELKKRIAANKKRSEVARRKLAELKRERNEELERERQERLEEVKEKNPEVEAWYQKERERMEKRRSRHKKRHLEGLGDLPVVSNPRHKKRHLEGLGDLPVVSDPSNAEVEEAGAFEGGAGGQLEHYNVAGVDKSEEEVREDGAV